MSKNGFTLSEVLITLGILGIVAALTLPALISKHRKHVIETKLQKFYSMMNQAVLMSEQENGDKMTWPNLENDTWTADERFDFWNTYFIPYLKVAKVEKGPYTNVYLADGSFFWNYGCRIEFYPRAKDYIKMNRNRLIGRDSFSFAFAPDRPTFPDNYGKGVEPYTGSLYGDFNKLTTSTSYGCNMNSLTDLREKNSYCTLIIQRNGWKIPDDYPIKF